MNKKWFIFSVLAMLFLTSSEGFCKIDEPKMTLFINNQTLDNDVYVSFTARTGDDVRSVNMKRIPAEAG